MSGESLYSIACEMLQHTNVFPKAVSDLKYSSRWEEEEISLLGLVEAETKKHNHRFRGKSEKNIQTVYNCISNAMVLYLESYPAVFSFKQQTKEHFRSWLEAIAQTYSVTDRTIPDTLYISAQERDSGVAMLKMLHDRKGSTYSELQKGLGDISDRAVQKDLVKLSPALYTGKGVPGVPFRLGGQPLLADIELVDPNEKRAEYKRFYTLNSVHPLVLQENILQLGTLLKALAWQYYKREDDVSRIIAVDIWSQMSEYARNKIIDYFTFEDEDLDDLVKELQNCCPDDHACIFHTERSMLQKIEMPIDQALTWLMKVPGRVGIIKLICGNQIVAAQVTPTVTSDGCNSYRVVDREGNTTTITKNQIEDIIINR